MDDDRLEPSNGRTFAATTIALLAFAANSVLCRLALEVNLIDAGSFTAIRLLSGAAVLSLLLLLASPRKKGKQTDSKGSWSAALMLFVYAVSFSFAYRFIDTGTGALILFAAVQITMVIGSLYQGKKLLPLEWFGLIVAFSGLLYLLLPGLSLPSFQGGMLMILAGVAWAIYTLMGRNSTQPLSDTAFNFLRTLPLVALLMAVSLPAIQVTTEGAGLAILSGGLASGLGYGVWYFVLPQLRHLQAGVIQLLVPVLAAVGGVVFVGETFSLRFVVAAIIVLGGILLVTLARQSSKLSLSR